MPSMVYATVAARATALFESSMPRALGGGIEGLSVGEPYTVATVKRTSEQEWHQLSVVTSSVIKPTPTC
jgi:hypothetical protein